MILYVCTYIICRPILFCIYLQKRVHNSCSYLTAWPDWIYRQYSPVSITITTRVITITYSPPPTTDSFLTYHIYGIHVDGDCVVCQLQCCCQPRNALHLPVILLISSGMNLKSVSSMIFYQANTAVIKACSLRYSGIRAPFCRVQTYLLCYMQTNLLRCVIHMVLVLLGVIGVCVVQLLNRCVCCFVVV